MTKRELWDRLQRLDPAFAAMLSEVSREFGTVDRWRYKSESGEYLQWPVEEGR